MGDRTLKFCVGFEFKLIYWSQHDSTIGTLAPAEMWHLVDHPMRGERLGLREIGPGGGPLCLRYAEPRQGRLLLLGPGRTCTSETRSFDS